MEETAVSAKRLLFSYLKELEEEELKHFRSLLEQRLAPCAGANAPGRRAKRDEYMDTAYHLIQHYGEERALEVAADLLSQVSRLQLSEQLMQASRTYFKQRRNEEQEKASHRKKYTDGLIQRWNLQEDNICLGERLDLKDRCPKLLRLRNFSQPDGREHEILSSGKRHQEVKDQTLGTFCSEVADLFEPEKDGHIPRIVVLQGAAGIGKTRLARKIMLDWASGKLYQDKFESVFYVHCRDIDRHHAPQSVGDLLVQSCLQMATPTLGLLDDPRKLLFIIDGFDELRCPLLPLEAEHPPMVNSQSSALGKSLLCKSSMVITTRPTAVEQLRKCVKVQHLKEILGFSQEDIEGYFHCFFGNINLGAQVFQFLQENRGLLGMCFIPTVCRIVCTVAKQHIEKGEALSCAPCTMTSVYLSFLNSFLKQQGHNSPNFIQSPLKRLCALAKDGVHEKKILFEEEDIRRYGLTFSDIQSILQNEVIFHKAAKDQNLFSFVHLSFQEFLAALSYILRENDEVSERTGRQPDVMELLGACRKPNQKHLLLTLRFVFGLLNPKAMNQMEKTLKWKIASEIKTDLLLWITEGIKESSGKISDLVMELLYCLYEIKEEDFVTGALEHFKNVEFAHFRQLVDKMDFRVLIFCLKNSPVIEKLSISNYKMAPAEMNALMHCTLECTGLRFCNGSLTAACCTELANMLKKSVSLEELVLRDNHRLDPGVPQLCEGLRHPGCKVRKLDMCCCSLTGSCCADLASVLRTAPSLEELILADNALGDSGVSQLCKGLQDPQCKLQKLQLENCSLTGLCCGDLASALSINQSLTELILRKNELGDSGMSKLCGGLKHPSCRIQNLELSECSLTGSCCVDLSVVLCAKTSLKALDLGLNHLEDSGVTQLCQGLKHPNCRLKKLNLWLCYFTASCCADLASALMASPTLTELNLSDNELQDSGLRQLCEGLKHPDCKLQKLDLESTALTDGCVADLSSVLSTNETLQQLCLHYNYFTDASVPSFLQLKETCIHRCDIRLGVCEFSAQGIEDRQPLTNEAA